MEAMEGRRQEMDECCTAAADAAGKENMEMCVCACNCAALQLCTSCNCAREEAMVAERSKMRHRNQVRRFLLKRNWLKTH